MTTACPFCTLSQSQVIATSDFAIAIRDSYPVAPGHTLVIPKRHVASYFDITSEERADIWTMLEMLKTQIDKEFKPSGYNIGINIGEAAGQTVMHLHVHLIPRYEGDMSDPRGGVRGVIPEKQNYKLDD